jgi:hypothetical protein
LLTLFDIAPAVLEVRDVGVGGAYPGGQLFLKHAGLLA